VLIKISDLNFIDKFRFITIVIKYLTIQFILIIHLSFLETILIVSAIIIMFRNLAKSVDFSLPSDLILIIT
jgi:hypothetical protein